MSHNKHTHQLSNSELPLDMLQKKILYIMYRADVNVTSKRTEKTRNPWTLEGANNICCGSFKCDLPRFKLSGSTEAFPLFKRANKEH